MITLPIPFLGSFYIECEARNAFKGRVLQFYRVRGEWLFRAAFVHGIFTPKGLKVEPAKAA